MAYLLEMANGTIQQDWQARSGNLERSGMNIIKIIRDWDTEHKLHRNTQKQIAEHQRHRETMRKLRDEQSVLEHQKKYKETGEKT